MLLIQKWSGLAILYTNNCLYKINLVLLQRKIENNAPKIWRFDKIVVSLQRFWEKSRNRNVFTFGSTNRNLVHFNRETKSERFRVYESEADVIYGVEHYFSLYL